MLVPAMLHKEAILNGLKKYIYDDEMFFIRVGTAAPFLRYPMNLTGIITVLLSLTEIM